MKIEEDEVLLNSSDAFLANHINDLKGFSMHPKHLLISTLSTFLAFSVSTSVLAAPKVTWQTSKADAWQAPALTQSTAGLVFIRPKQSMSQDSSINLAINNRYLTSLNDGHYSSDVVCAGAVQISAAPTKALTNDLSVNAININLAPNQVQYVLVEVDNDFRPTLSPIGESQALNLISEGHRQVHQISRTRADDCQYTAASMTQPPVVHEPAPAHSVVPPSIALNIHFDHDKSVIKSDYRSELARAAEFLANYPDMNALIEGHADAVGTNAYNQALSERRAQAVRQALINKHNINPNRLTTQSYGETRPVASNRTAQGRAQNRHVVISIVP